MDRIITFIQRKMSQTINENIISIDLEANDLEDSNIKLIESLEQLKQLASSLDNSWFIDILEIN